LNEEFGKKYQNQMTKIKFKKHTISAARAKGSVNSDGVSNEDFSFERSSAGEGDTYHDELGVWKLLISNMGTESATCKTRLIIFTLRL
jgi:hypothetical protein